MDWIAVVLAGLAGTAVMTLFLYATPLIGLPEVDLMAFLGGYFTGRKVWAYLPGAILHFASGIIIGFVYVGLWELDFGRPSWGWGVIYGAVHGIFALLGILFLQQYHRRGPQHRPTVGWILSVLVAHALYGTILATAYVNFTEI